MEDIDGEEITTDCERRDCTCVEFPICRNSRKGNENGRP